MIDALLSPLWPFWLGALSLAGVSLAYFALTGGLIGASASYQRLLGFQEGRELDRAEAALPNDASALEAMLLAATLEEFGGEAAAPSSEIAAAPAPAKRLSTVEHAIFLGGMALGGVVSAALAGRFALRGEIAPQIVETFGSSFLSGAALVLGGVAVGVGTSMAGGCTSGHGLSGCGRLQPGSLLATAVFFGAGVAVAFALGALGGAS